MIKYENKAIVISSDTPTRELYAFERDLNLFLSDLNQEMEELGWDFEAEFYLDVFGIELIVRFLNAESGEMGELTYGYEIEDGDTEYELKRESGDPFLPEWTVVEDRIEDVLKVFFDGWGK